MKLSDLRHAARAGLNQLGLGREDLRSAARLKAAVVRLQPVSEDERRAARAVERYVDRLFAVEKRPLAGPHPIGVLLEGFDGTRLELRPGFVLHISRGAQAVDVPLRRVDASLLALLLSEKERNRLPLELEDRFECRSMPDVSRCKGEEIAEGFLAKSFEPRAYARVRRSPRERSLTFKLGPSGAARELVVPLTPEQCDLLWPLVVGVREKIRYQVSAGALRFDVDTFGPGKRCIAEVEHASADGRLEFWKRFHTAAPAWIGAPIHPPVALAR